MRTPDSSPSETSAHGIPTPPSLTRRNALKLIGGALAGLTLPSCHEDPSPGISLVMTSGPDASQPLDAPSPTDSITADVHDRVDASTSDSVTTEDAVATEDTLDTINEDTTTAAEDAVSTTDAINTNDTTSIDDTTITEDVSNTNDATPTEDAISTTDAINTNDTTSIDDTVSTDDTTVAEDVSNPDDTTPTEDVVDTTNTDVEVLPVDIFFQAKGEFPTTGPNKPLITLDVQAPEGILPKIHNLTVTLSQALAAPQPELFSGLSLYVARPETPDTPLTELTPFIQGAGKAEGILSFYDPLEINGAETLVIIAAEIPSDVAAGSTFTIKVKEVGISIPTAEAVNLLLGAAHATATVVESSL